MLQAYPVFFREDRNGTTIAEVPDVPGAMTVGGDRTEALERVQGALVLMLSAMMEDREPIPRPSKPKRGQSVVALPPLVAAKISIYQVMQQHGITQAELARRLGCDDRQVRRLLDLGHHSRLDQIEEALHVLGKRLILDIENAA